MTDIKLNPAEAQLLRTVLELLVVSTYSGEIGINHGADRFIPLDKRRPLSKPERELLDNVARRLGMDRIKVRNKA